MNRQIKSRVTIFLTITLVIAVPAFAQIPDGVSPGAADRTALIEGRCPTFIWDSVPGAAFHELVGYRLPGDSELADPAAVKLADADQVLYAKVSGSAPAWEPELAECLAPGGHYVWFVRAVYREEEGEVVEASEWSYGKYFSISSRPSAAEVEEALRVLRRYTGHQVDPEGLKTGSADTMRAAPRRRADVPGQASKSVTTAKAAIKGSVPDATGETYGVVGVSNSPNGAGVAAANTNGGADLVIDGSEDGQPDAVFTQAGIDRASPSEEWFFLINSDTGVLSLNVEGTIVGDGSGLTAVDADTLDGTEGSDFATDVEAAGLVTAHSASADHDGRYFTETELGTSGSSAVHWDNLTNVPAGLDDGDDDTTFTAGIGLELNGTQFSAIGFNFAPGDNSSYIVQGDQEAGEYSSITVGVDGLPVIGYYDSTNGDLKTAHCSDLACSSATLNTVDGVGDVGRYPSITVGADGLPLISYWDLTNNDLKVAHCENLECTSATLTAVDSTGMVGSFSSVTVGADGLPVISYKDSTNQHLKVAHCEDPGCTSATLTTVDSDSGAGNFTSITIGADGLPIVSHQYRFPSASIVYLKVAHCSNLACTSAVLSAVDGGVPDSGLDSSITVGIDGLPVISHSELGDLKVTHCSDLACSSLTLTTVIGTDAGRGTSISISVEGLPIVSYFDGINSDLMMAHCSDVACTSATNAIVDSTGDVGRYSSITVGADGLPIMSYWDSTHDDLKVSHCANEFCIPYARRR